MRTPRDPIYAGHHYPAEIISYAVWLYFRFPLSLRMVEEMLAARGIDRYEAVAGAYLNALERRIAANRPVAGISSVASFFLSRIDVLVDKLLESKADAHARDLCGKIAVANASSPIRA